MIPMKTLLEALAIFSSDAGVFFDGNLEVNYEIMFRKKCPCYKGQTFLACENHV
jgi:hypothetical protein